MDDDEIRTLVTRLARPHRAGGDVIERAAILAEGTDATAVFTWIAAHAGQPEHSPSGMRARGLHSAPRSERGATPPTPRRYVLPPGALS